jgi:hypothetical protein
MVRCTTKGRSLEPRRLCRDVILRSGRENILPWQIYGRSGSNSRRAQPDLNHAGYRCWGLPTSFSPADVLRCSWPGQSQLRRDGGAFRHIDPVGTAAPAARRRRRACPPRTFCRSPRYCTEVSIFFRRTEMISLKLCCERTVGNHARLGGGDFVLCAAIPFAM